MTDEIRKHIERMVTHLAREYQTTDDKVWEQMLITSFEHMSKIRQKNIRTK